MRKNIGRKGRLGWKVALSYFFMSVISVSLFSYVIFVNQGELISENTRFESKEKVTGLVLTLRRAQALPSSEAGFTSEDRRAIAARISQELSAVFPRHLLYTKDSILLSAVPNLTLPDEARNEATKARVLREQAGADYIMRADFEHNLLRFYIPLDEFALDGATALLEMDFHQVQIHFNKLFRQILFTVIAISLLHILFALFIHRMVIRPIVKLTKAAENISNGDYDQEIPQDGKDELGELATTFQLMTSKIKSQIWALNSKNEDLSKANDSLNEAYRKIHELAVTDELTGLYNRHYLYESLQKDLQTSDRYKRTLGLLMLDVDHFKRVNDTYGHSAGDSVLKHIAAILKHTVRQSDLVARYGGEEMIVILPETDAHGSVITAEKIRVIIANTPIPIGPEQTLRVSVSIGVGEYQELKNELGKIPEIRDLINAADEALYRAKENGRNRVVVHEPMVKE